MEFLMSRIIVIALFVLLPVFAVSAQNKPQEKKTAGSQVQRKAAAKSGTGGEAVQTESASCNDQSSGGDARRGCGQGKSKKQCGRSRDTFIDKDGDGINDNRCSGMGLQKRCCRKRCAR
jgi:hypothetical protein